MAVKCNIGMQFSALLSRHWKRCAFPITRTLHISSRCLAQPVSATERFPGIKRGGFASLTNADLDFFKQLMPEEGRVLTGEDEVDGYNRDWLGIIKGSSKLVLRPQDTGEVSEILKYCNSRTLAVCPQGGNTGLVMGSVPLFDEIIISTQLMNKIISVDEVAGILVCQSGCVLEYLNQQLERHNLIMPLDLGAKGSCHIGGNVSTNAGGIRLLRYGSLHGSVLGVEAVLASGEVVDCMKSLRKDNTGYDIKQLFIGSEGTLGFITGVSILCPRKPNAVNVAFLGCDSFDKVLETFQATKDGLAEVLSAYEFMDNGSMECVVNNLNLTNPISTNPFYVLVETSGSNARHDEEKLNTFIERAISSGLVTDGTVATQMTQQQHIWGLRERVAEGLLHDGYCYKYDISVPTEHFYAVVEEMKLRLDGLASRVVGYGHVGDGNLHFNATSPEYDPEVALAIEPYIYEYTGKLRGSISAEHGMGLMKNNYIHFSQAPASIKLMNQMKAMMDPNGILNPYKTLPTVVNE